MMLASVEDLADRLGQTLTVGTPDYKRAKANLFDASALVTRETRRWTPGDAIPDVVVTVTLAAAERKFRNPSGLETRSTGPFSEGFATTTGVYLTEDELRVLADYADRPANGIVSVPTMRVGERPYRRWRKYVMVTGSSGEPVPYFPDDCPREPVLIDFWSGEPAEYPELLGGDEC